MVHQYHIPYNIIISKIIKRKTIKSRWKHKRLWHRLQKNVSAAYGMFVLFELNGYVVIEAKDFGDELANSLSRLQQALSFLALLVQI